MLRLTDVDQSRVESLLRRPWIGAVPELERVLQRMPDQGKQAAIEILGAGLEDWVKRRIPEEV